MRVTVSEIHAYPLRPHGYAEPLFHDRGSRKEILEHLARSSWLRRASEAECPAPTPVEELAPFAGLLASWREVDRWWEPDGGVDAVWRLVETQDGVQRAVVAPASAA
jgi:hypothetical protein